MSIPKSASTSSQFLDSFVKGAGVMVIQAPLVNGLNRVSVVSCYTNSPTIPAIQSIYSGAIDKKETSSFLHFQKGMTAHVVRECARLIYKPWGLAVLKPRLDEHYLRQGAWGAFKSSLIFSSVLSLFEMAINPADTLRTVWQSGKSLRGSLTPGQSLVKHLYAGSWGNGGRQFTIWMGYSVSDRLCTDLMEKHTSINPHNFPGILIKSLPVSFLFTLPSWGFERVKNELQYRPELIAKAKKFGQSRYRIGFRNILKKQGFKGLCRGFIPKVWGNGVLAAGASFLVELGRKKKE